LSDSGTAYQVVEREAKDIKIGIHIKSDKKLRNYTGSTEDSKLNRQTVLCDGDKTSVQQENKYRHEQTNISFDKGGKDEVLIVNLQRGGPLDSSENIAEAEVKEVAKASRKNNSLLEKSLGGRLSRYSVDSNSDDTTEYPKESGEDYQTKSENKLAQMVKDNPVAFIGLGAVHFLLSIILTLFCFIYPSFLSHMGDLFSAAAKWLMNSLSCI